MPGSDEKQKLRMQIGDGARFVSEQERDALMRQGKVLAEYSSGPKAQPLEGEGARQKFMESQGRVEKANRWKETTPRKLLNERDPLQVGHQEYAVVACVVPGDTMSEQAKADRILLKVCGCFDTEEAAADFGRELIRRVPFIDLHVLRTGYFTPFPPSEKAAKGIPRKSIDPVAMEIMQSHYDKENKYRERQLERISDSREAGREGRPGRGHEDMPELEPAKIEFRAARDVGVTGPSLLDPESDEPRWVGEPSPEP